MGSKGGEPGRRPLMMPDSARDANVQMILVHMVSEAASSVGLLLVAFLDELLVLSGPMHLNDSCENRVCFIDRPVERGAIGSWGPRECLLIAALRHVEIGMR